MFLTANRISQLFSEQPRKGQGIFPELIKKLIIASGNSNDIRFPAEDSIWAHSFDGIIENKKGAYGLIPEGKSVWELGTSKNVKKKANDDFDTRTNIGTLYDKSEYTFIFCTPHIWSGDVLEWKTEKINLGVWKDVKLIDGTIIADFLNSNLEIAIWLLHSFDPTTPIGDITTLDIEIKRVHSLTDPNLTNEIMICSNEENAKLFVDSLEKGFERYNVIRPTTNIEQGYYFVLAALASENNAFVNSKVVIAKSKEALDTINLNCEDKIIIISYAESQDYYHEKNRYVFISTEKVQTPTLELSPTYFEDFRKALENMGIDAIESYDITQKVNRNISSLKRKYAVNPMIKKPNWSDASSKNDIIPIALLSEVDMSKESDIEILSQIVDGKVEEYFERINSWLVHDDPPIFKDGSIYRIYSKEESIGVLNLSYDSPKVSLLEQICFKQIFVTKNRKYEKKRTRGVDFEEYKYSTNLIRGILDSFAILSFNKEAQIHYDFFVSKLMSIIKSNSVLINTFASYFSILSEISAKSIIDFTNEALDQDDTPIQNLLFNTGSGFSPRSNLIYLYWSIQQMLYQKDYAIDAQKTLLKLYLKDYHSPNKSQIDEEIVASFAPILSCEYVPTPTEKLDILLAETNQIDFNKTQLAEKIFYKMRLNQVNHYAISSKLRWKSSKKHDDTINPQEFINVNDRATEWLYQNATNKIDLFLNIIDRGILSIVDENYISKIFIDIDEKLVKKITDSETKRLLNTKVGQICSEYVKYKIQNEPINSLIISNLTNIYNNTLSNDLLEKNRHLFENEGFDFYNEYYEEDLSFEEMQSKAESMISGVVNDLLEERGSEVLDVLLKITNDNNFLVWSVLFKFFIDKQDLMKRLITLNKKAAFISVIYNSKEFDKDMEKLILNIKDKEQLDFILQNLPLFDSAIDFAEKYNFETIFWDRQQIPYSKISEKIYNKMLKFCPLNLLVYLLRPNETLDYEKSIQVIKSIIIFLETNSDSAEKKLNSSNAGFLVRLFDKLDEKFYTDELALYEFRLLAIYMASSVHSKYPRGVQEYFWRHPEEYFTFFKELLFDGNNFKKLQDRSLGQKMQFHAIQPFGKVCIIPVDYMLSKEEEFKNWCNAVMNDAEKEEKSIVHRFASMIVNIMALCPETESQLIWPNKVVADLLDNMNKYWSAEDMRKINEIYKEAMPNGTYRSISKEKYIASNFSISKTNSIGIRTVRDGTYEFSMAEKYFKYADQYKITNPVTSEALIMIAKSYQRDGNDDRRRAIMGNQF